MTMSLALHSCSALVFLFIYGIVLALLLSSFLLIQSCVLPAFGSVILYYNICGGYTTCIDLILDCSVLYVYQHRVRNSSHTWFSCSDTVHRWETLTGTAL